jgi:hypothetical protein
MKKNNDIPGFTEESALAFFARRLDELKWKYRRYEGRPVLYSGFNCDAGQWDFNMTARETSSGLFLLAVNSFIPNKARPECRAAGAELITRINFELSLGCFEMNYDEGEFRFRTSMIAPAADITAGIVEHLIRSNLCIVEERFPQIMAVLYAGVTPADAMKKKEPAPDAHPQPRFELN